MRVSILLIEDDQWLADLYRDVLQAADFMVHHAVSAEQGLAMLDEQKDIACIVLDMFLPSHNGIEFLHEYGSYVDIATIPVVVLSSILPEDIGMSEQRWRQYGVEQYLYKPTTKPALLVSTVAHVVQTAKERRLT